MFVGLKDAVFQPSSPLRHACELFHVLQDQSLVNPRPILFIYSDGGSDHRLTFFSVQLSLITLFLQLDLDYLCACRTAPYHSWKNPVERIMSVLNLGLQCVGLARSEMPEEFEKEVSKCNNLSKLRKIPSRVEGFRETVADSLSPVKVLLGSVFMRLKLHDEYIRTFVSASQDELDSFWTAILALDATLEKHKMFRKDDIEKYPQIVEFLNHCCKSSQYSFGILKCGQTNCKICKPTQLSSNIFEKLKHLPHPTPGEDGHYIPFHDVFGTQTTEEHRPSFKKKPTAHVRRKDKSRLSYYASVQHAKNVDIVVQCDECNLWRVIFSKFKLKKEQRVQLQLLLDDFSYTCGSKLKDLQLPDEFTDVEIRDHDCFDPIEKLYYSAKNEPICVYCGQTQPFTSDDQYPQCDSCLLDSPIIKKA